MQKGPDYFFTVPIVSMLRMTYLGMPLNKSIN